MWKSSGGKTKGSQVNGRSFFHKKKRDAELAKRRARAKVDDDIEEIDLGIGKDAEVWKKK